MAQPLMNASRRTLLAAAPAQACSICGSHEIAVDEVYEHGHWRLSECRRCENQWTDGPSGGPRRPLARVAAVAQESHAEAA